MKKNLILALRFTAEEYDYLDFCKENVEIKTGIEVGRSWIIGELMKLGKKSFERKYIPKKYKPENRTAEIEKLMKRNS